MKRWRSSPLMGLAVAVLFVAVLYVAKPVLLPLTVALLLTVVLSPAVSRLERIGLGPVRIGRVGSVLVVAVVVAGVFGGVGWTLGVQGGALVEKLPEYRRKAVANLREPIDSLRRLERTAREVREMTEAPPSGEPRPSKVEVVDGDSELVGFARDWAGSLASLLSAAGLVIVLLGFLLVERESLRDRLIRVVASGDLRTTTQAFADAVERVTSYLRTLALVNLGHGGVVAAGLFLFGLPGALLFGLLSTTLRFIPFLGPWLAASLPIALAFVTGDDWTLPLGVLLFFVGLELMSNNVFEPLVIGSRVGLSPLAMILAVIFWAWLWGPVGLVLAAPITACGVAFGRHVPSLEPLAILLGDAEALSPAQRLYQRLLAHDVAEATELLAAHTEKLGALQAWDEVALPVLCRLEQDGDQQWLDDEQLEAARETFELWLSELPEGEADASKPFVLCLPARDGWDDVVCMALARFLAGAGVPARALGHKLSAEFVAEVERADPAWICISCLRGNPRHLLKRIRRDHPEARVVVGLWARAPEPKPGGMAAEPGTYVVDRLGDATERVRSSIPA